MAKIWYAWLTSLYDLWQIQKSHFVICLLYGVYRNMAKGVSCLCPICKGMNWFPKHFFLHIKLCTCHSEQFSPLWVTAKSWLFISDAQVKCAMGSFFIWSTGCQSIKNTLHFFQNWWKILNDQFYLGVRIFSSKKIYNDQIYLGVRIFSVKKILTIKFAWVLEFF